MHDRIAKEKIRKAHLIGFAAGCLFSILLASILPSKAHTPCDQDCRYVTEIDLETGKVTQKYICD